jgi:peptidoglycan biosynthesis protein MviN/MurJ (putative lipid II flippase)
MGISAIPILMRERGEREREREREFIRVCMYVCTYAYILCVCVYLCGSNWLLMGVRYSDSMPGA